MNTTTRLLGAALAAALVAPATGCLGDRAAADKGADAAATSPDTGADALADAAADAGSSVPLLALGKACVASAECQTGRCALPCVGYGVCAPASCKVDEDCKVPDSDVTHCCIAGRCDAIAGSVCGGRKGNQGAACGGGGPTDCAADLLCLDGCMPHAYCAAACEDDAACAAVGKGLKCYKVAGDGPRCVEDPEGSKLHCELDADCPAGAVCAPSLSFDGAKVRQTCQQPAGKSGVGATCMAGGMQPQCRSGMCFDGLCSAMCKTDADCTCAGKPDCKVAQTCLDVTFTVSGAFKDSARMCYPAPRCESTAKCVNSVCTAWAGKKGWEKVCVAPPKGARAVGAACSVGEQCRTGACHQGACRELCVGDANCKGGGTCKQVELIGLVPQGSLIGLCM